MWVYLSIMLEPRLDGQSEGQPVLVVHSALSGGIPHFSLQGSHQEEDAPDLGVRCRPLHPVLPELLLQLRYMY